MRVLLNANDIVRGFVSDDHPDDWTYEHMRTESNVIGRVVNKSGLYSNIEMEHIIVTIREFLDNSTVLDWAYFQSVDETVIVFATGDHAKALSLLEHVFDELFEPLVCAKI